MPLLLFRAKNVLFVFLFGGVSAVLSFFFFPFFLFFFLRILLQPGKNFLIFLIGPEDWTSRNRPSFRLTRLRNEWGLTVLCCQSRRRFLVSPYFLPFHPPPPFSSRKIAATGVESLARVKSAGRTMESDYVDGKGSRSVGLGTKTIAVFPELGIRCWPTRGLHPRSRPQLEIVRSRNRMLVEMDYRERGENKGRL